MVEGKIVQDTPATPVEGPRKPKGFSQRFKTFESLQFRDFRFMWAGTFAASAGQWLQQVTLSWLIFDLTGSAVQLGAVNGVRLVPFLFAGPIGGAAADRFDRRMLLIVSHLFLAVTGLIFAVDIAAGTLEVWHIYAFTLVGGLGFTFGNPVRQSLIPQLVPPNYLMNAIALGSAAFNVSRAVGPAIAGLLIATVGTASNFFIQAVLYVVVVAMLAQIRLTEQGDDGGTASGVSLFGKLVEGVRYATGERLVLLLLALTLVPSLLLIPYTAMVPVFAEDVFDVGPTGLGYLYSAAGAGALVGTLIVASLGNIQWKGHLLVVSALAWGASVALWALTPWFLVSLLGIFMVGVAQMIYLTTNNTIIMTIVPNEFRGRVMSLWMLDFGLVPIGTVAAGFLTEWIGAPKGLAIMAVIGFVFMAVMFVSYPLLRRIR